MPGNSYVQPVAGEPSWGTPHTNVAQLVSGVDPASTGNVTVTCSTAPTGANGIFGRVSQTALTAGRVVNIKNVSGTTYAECINPAAGLYGAQTFVVPIDSNKQFVYNASNADVASVYIVQLGYFI
jgi:hypothetical protein